MIIQVKGNTIVGNSSFLPAERTEYSIITEFNSIKDNEELLNNYIENELRIDLNDRQSNSRFLYTDENFAIAAAVHYFRQIMVRFNFHELSYLFEKPNNDPDSVEQGYKIWIKILDKQKEPTVRNAGYELYLACAYTKLSIAQAKSLISDKFPKSNFKWSEVLSAFSSHGGRYTEKYLRRNN